MNYRIFPKIPDCQISVLGFGLMRLPLLPNSDEIDKEKTRNLVKLAVSQGVNYFDTAYPYHQGKSEIVFGEIVKEENLRDKIYIADKFPIWEANKEEDFYRILDEQLNKLQTDHIDFYLLHAMDAERWEKVKNLNGLKFLENSKANGKIKYIGFSFHDNFDSFKKICDDYSGFDFCQLQFNYIDEDGEKRTQNPGWQGLKYAAQKELGVIVMEPLRGGLLANPPVGIREIFASADVPRLPAEWALRYVWENQEVITALSGMNDENQILVNCAVASTAFPNSMPNSQLEVVKKAQSWFESKIKVPCTGCKYCVPCPKGVSIPEVFDVYNNASMRGLFEQTDKIHSSDYKNLVNWNKGANLCVNCKACAKHCPQHIDIPSKLQEAHNSLFFE